MASAESAVAAPAPLPKLGLHSDLTTLISQSKVTGLNVLNPTHMFYGDKHLAASSDADSQMIISLPLSQNVKLMGLLVGSVAGSQPTKIKVFVNKPSIGFEDIEEFAADAEVNIKDGEMPADGSPKEFKFKFSTKLSNCAHLTIFFDSEGNDKVTVSTLRIVGEPLELVDMSKFDRTSG